MNSAVHRDRQSEIKPDPQHKDFGSGLEPGHRSGKLTESVVRGFGQVGIGGMQGCERLRRACASREFCPRRLQAFCGVVWSYILEMENTYLFLYPRLFIRQFFASKLQG